ncbi:MAG: hypothetical protein ACFE9D_06125 [Promethearchaeota archaeon]
MNEKPNTLLGRLGPQRLSLAYIAFGINIVGVILVFVTIETWSIEGLFLVAFVLFSIIGPAYGTYLLYIWLKPSRYFLVTAALILFSVFIFLYWFIGKAFLIGFPLTLPIAAAASFIGSSILYIVLSLIIAQLDSSPHCPACKKSLGKWANEDRCRWCGAQLQEKRD